MEYLIAEVARNLMNQKNIWNQILVKIEFPYEKTSAQKAIKSQQKTFSLVLWTQREIHDTSNGHIEIDDRMRSILGYPGRGERVVTMLKSVTITTHQKSTTLEGPTKRVTCTFFGHWNSRYKYKGSPIGEFSYPGHRIKRYCEALLSQNIGYFASKTCTKVL